MPTGSMPLPGAIIGERSSELAESGTTIEVSPTMKNMQAAHGAFPQHRRPPHTFPTGDSERSSCAILTRTSSVTRMTMVGAETVGAATGNE